MRDGIHPTYFPNAQVICACGNTWTTGSTKEVIRTDVCSNCHPFFTGEQRIVDTAGQVDRFMRRLQQAEQRAAQQRVQQKAEDAARKAAAQARARGERPEKVKAIAELAADSVLAELEIDAAGTSTNDAGDLVVTAEHFAEKTIEIDGENIVADVHETVTEITGDDSTTVIDETVISFTEGEVAEVIDETVTTITEGDLTEVIDETVTMATEGDVTEITDEIVTTLSDGKTMIIEDEIGGEIVEDDAE